ncbi:type III secretion system stalk subunit SctO [Candidatus Thiothrix anitrata]|jgi:hypothetical protein|uniref:YscO family type III secretion system apparatus protein n=1 Tax=Candidatus Thiothrix anitrata TaxID=2823902 RepID=A0ABX7X5J4_9GAMM|nr:YscO family type III secretion system apparatus protein [Candidatus Thiothrix anitrata]QTR51141.1 YscO family type III secretion system apparatus protein [Candidatus Thiothrix anitrata]
MDMDLAQLKKLRARRVEQCFIELQTQRKILDEWNSYQQKQEQQLLDFQKWRLNYQESLFDSLKHQTFNPQALLDYHLKLDQLQQEENNLRDALKQTYASLKAASMQVDIAQQDSSSANIKLEKLKEIMKVHDAKKPSEEPAQ